MKICLFLLMLTVIGFQMVFSQADSSIVVDQVDNSALVYLENAANIAISSEGKTVVAWQTAADVSQIAVSLYDSEFGEWGAPQEISTAVFQAMNPALAADQSGNIYALWQQQDDTSTYKERDALFFSKFNGTSWSAPVDVTGYDFDNGEASINVASDGTVFIVWNTDGDDSLEAVFTKNSADGGDTWSDAVQLSAGHAELRDQSDAGRAVLAAGSDGKMVAVWANKPNTAYAKMETFCNIYNGSSWSEPALVSDSSRVINDRFPSVVVDSQDSIHILIQDYESNANRFLKMHTKAWDDAEWPAAADTIVNRGFQTSYPFMVIDANDNIHVTFRRKAQDALTVSWENAYTMSSDGGKTWTEQNRISRYAHDAAYASIAVASDHVAAVWRETDSVATTSGPYSIPYIQLAAVTALHDGNGNSPAIFDLQQNFPNPFNPSTHITFSVSKTDDYT
ncbi:MAG TPA: hypothetical protein ENO27_00375, partial [Caldithrix sp.]|nr:hypothetical protein [Caldithrix sp.]